MNSYYYYVSMILLAISYVDNSLGSNSTTSTSSQSSSASASSAAAAASTSSSASSSIEFSPFKSVGHTKDVDSFNVIENDNLQLMCEVVLRSEQKDVQFNWYRVHDDGEDEEIKGGDRNITNDPGDDTQSPPYFRKSFLQLDNVQFKDRGLYICEAGYDNVKANNTVYVRIKSRMAALYPFLGICAEVTILCVIIFVYERRRSKSELGRGDASSYDKGKSQAKMS
ncbi:immunoglobulin domain-containing protein Bsg [Brevipalpus obovatus]|uniref:immunoglobulin domain-containing protein Bsg n=1 Tax=Brevipalpus obovatus TaxID=246614 RepID=UPI003D9EC38C